MLSCKRAILCSSRFLCAISHTNILNLFQKTKLGVVEVRETADEFINQGHFDSETISACAMSVEKKWERLMKMAEQRRAVVFTSYNFYRASEQVIVREFVTTIIYKKFMKLFS